MQIGILCGGGPAPGFNGVIEAVVLAAASRGWSVVGIPNGYRDLMDGDTSKARVLAPADVRGIAGRGGGILFTSRANPKKSPSTMDNVVQAVRELGLDALVTIGGDDTASSAAAVADAIDAGGKRLRVAHVPKTIDNDLPLPGMAPTFGFETAKQVGATLCRNLLVDAQTTGRWYLVTAMGRSAGHLGLGMAMGAGADLVLIREEFEDRAPVPLDAVADFVEAAILKRRAQGVDAGLVVLAEGILEVLAKDDLQRIANLEIDEHGNPRMSEIDLGKAVRDVVDARLRKRGIKIGWITKIIGYELRCADPVAFDVQYTRCLGAGAVQFLEDGAGDGIITLREGSVEVLRFEDLRGPDGRIPVRRVDLDGSVWQGSLRLTARLGPDDLQGAGLAQLAEAGRDEPDSLAARFAHLAPALPA